MEELLNNHKKRSFIGYGASSKNGSEDCYIKTVTTMARTMLLHAALIFTDETLYTDILPMTMDYYI